MILLRARSVLAALVVGGAVLGIPGGGILAHPASPTPSAESLTQSLVALSARYQLADPADHALRMGHLLSVAAARQQLLAALV